MSKFQNPKGTFDILPTRFATLDWQASSWWQFLETILHKCSQCYGFEEIRTPIFEPTQLFFKSTGETTDIVQKEMYTFEDKGGRSLTLRPEGTPSALRSLIQSQAHTKGSLTKVYYLGPMFRYERPQAGRYRQFQQFGVEVLGPKSAIRDVEVIALSHEIFSCLGLKKLKVLINTLGNFEDRKNYRQVLIDFFSKNKENLSLNSQKRLLTNPLRILDSKDKEDQWVKKEAPKITDYLSLKSQNHFQEVLSLLSELKIPVEIDPMLVRGIDYYCDTVFEIHSSDIGAQSALGGGGCYDHLYQELGGSNLSGVGFAMGCERILQAIVSQANKVNPVSELDLYFIGIGKSGQKQCFLLMDKLRKQGVHTDLSPFYQTNKIKDGLKEAKIRHARFVAILGDDELSNGYVQLKHMDSHEQKTCTFDNLLTKIMTP
jgi:histidyl-tRNA synthetase